MATLDLSTLSITEANERIRTLGEQGTDIEIINPDARHHIGVGLTAPVNVKVKGSAGYFCAGLSDGASFEIEHNVGWAVGDNMYAGSVIVGGNAGAIPGVAIRGADIVVKGNMGSRAGQVMKAGNLICAGNSNFMAGYMMYGGRIVILGNSGEQVGQDMTAGEIFVAGDVQSLGADAMLTDLDSTDTDEIRALLDKYEISFKGALQKVVNAGTKLRYAKQEPRTRPQPFFVSSGRSDYWNAKVQEDIFIKAGTGRYRIRGYGASKPMAHFNDIAFRKDLSHAGNDADALTRVNLETKIGGRYGAKPLSLSMPVQIAPMSFGALSKKSKIALATASRMSGISENTGEGGMLEEARQEADQLVFQCLSGRLGWNIKDMQRADGLEIYISQGAKPGLGGQLMAKKITPELAEKRGIPEGIDLRSPSRHPDVLGADDLVIKLEEFREATGHKIPVSIKMGAGRVKDDIKIAYKDGFDYVALDGLQGSTGAASTEVLENVGIPTVGALIEAKLGLAEIEAGDDMQLVIMGGIKDGIDAAKAIALGADAVAMGTAAIIAGGCIACMQCHVGTCPVGIATQDPEHTDRYDNAQEALNIHRFLEGVRWQMAAITDALGYDDIHKLSPDDLVALTPEAAAITGLEYVPGHVDLQNSALKKA
ncbi:glutamate synthase-related protein [Magnetovibrio sp. PR-2]|uniref:glutamate synthase-related protein n=1 Tax=Magnetovibrio sp. PR-2 TaxID=3120356 RepID=UPI002FCE08A2